MAEQEKSGGIRFDATVNLGHILTFVGFLVTGFAAYENLDKRVLILEQNNKVQDLRDHNQDTTQNEQNANITASLIEIKRSIEKVNDKLDRRP